MIKYLTPLSTKKKKRNIHTQQKRRYANEYKTLLNNLKLKATAKTRIAKMIEMSENKGFNGNQLYKIKLIISKE